MVARAAQLPTKENKPAKAKHPKHPAVDIHSPGSEKADVKPTMSTITSPGTTTKLAKIQPERARPKRSSTILKMVSTEYAPYFQFVMFRCYPSANFPHINTGVAK